MPVTTTNAIKMNNDILINWLSNYFFEILNYIDLRNLHKKE
jgi:hypothetical protein